MIGASPEHQILVLISHTPVWMNVHACGCAFQEDVAPLCRFPLKRNLLPVVAVALSRPEMKLCPLLRIAVCWMDVQAGNCALQKDAAVARRLDREFVMGISSRPEVKL